MLRGKVLQWRQHHSLVAWSAWATTVVELGQPTKSKSLLAHPRWSHHSRWMYIQTVRGFAIPGSISNQHAWIGSEYQYELSPWFLVTHQLTYYRTFNIKVSFSVRTTKYYGIAYSREGAFFYAFLLLDCGLQAKEPDEISEQRDCWISVFILTETTETPWSFLVVGE